MRALVVGYPAEAERHAHRIAATERIGFLAYPAAPPRLAGIDIADTVSHGPIIGYALVVAMTLLRYAWRSPSRVFGALYPPFVLLVIVATGNHFFLDAAAGAVTVALAAGSAHMVMRTPRYAQLARLPAQSPPARRSDVDQALNDAIL